jgi:hypothetical protein
MGSGGIGEGWAEVRAEIGLDPCRYFLRGWMADPAPKSGGAHNSTTGLVQHQLNCNGFPLE